MKDLEKRGGALGVEFRAVGDKRTLVGYAAVFNSDTKIGDYFIERIDPGAFDKSLNSDVRALYDHDWGRVIGRTKSGTLRLSIDARGLRCEIDVPNTTDGNDLWVSVERGDISGMSFAFRATKDLWDETGDLPQRTILDLELYEVSAVALPAYEDTSIGIRSLESARNQAAAEMAAAEARATVAETTTETKRKEEAEAEAARNKEAAIRRISERKAKMEMAFRGIR